MKAKNSILARCISRSAAVFLTLGWVVCASAQTVDVVVTNGLVEPHSIAVDTNGTLYITDQGGLSFGQTAANRIVRYIPATGSLFTLAGDPAGTTGTNNNATPNAGYTARFYNPAGIVLARGGLVVADSGNHTIRYVGFDGVVSNIAGMTTVATNLNGVGAAAGFNTPIGLAVDAAQNIYVADSKNNAIRMIDPANNVTTYATNFNQPSGVSVGANGDLWVADTLNHQIKTIDANGVVTVRAGTGVAGSSDTFPLAVTAQLSYPRGVLWAGTNGLFITDTGNSTLRRLYTNSSIGTFTMETTAGVAGQTGLINGVTNVARFNALVGLATNAATGTILLADQGNKAVRSYLQPQPGGGGNGGGPVSPPLLSITPNSGYYPVGTRVTVSSSSPFVYYTTDGSAPTTNSPALTMNSGVGTISFLNPTNDLTTLRVVAFAYNGTNSASTNVGGIAATTTTIGVPTGLNTNILAGQGAQVVVPVVVNLRTNDTLRSLQFRVEVSANGGAPIIGSTFRTLNVGTNDFVTVAGSSTPATFSTLAYPAGATTRGLTISYLGTNGNLTLNRFGVVAMVVVPIPAGAAVGSTYSVNLVYASGTSDAAQTDVPITTAGSQTIVVTNLSYIVGDTSPGGWYNAGDFGNTNLNNADVNNAFAAASGLRLPYAFSDVFDAMDAFPEDTAGTVGGDGQIRFLDWQIILLRSLRLNTNPALGVSTTNWSRSWNGLKRTTGMTNLTPAAVRAAAVTPPGLVWNRQAAIGALPLDNVQPGATVFVPVFVRVAPGAMVSGLQFRAVVTPSAGAPAPAQAPQFLSLNQLLTPSIVSGLSNAVAAGWNVGQLALPALSSNLLGFVEFTVPQTAAAGSSYAVSFANADGSPNLFTQYDFETRGATVWVQRPAAAPPSLISDEWKIQFFGSTTDPRADDLADPDGDGVPNVLEYFAGTDPTDPNSKVQVQNGGLSNGGQTLSLQLLSAPSKYYVLEGSPSVVGGTWTPVATNLGDGNVQQFIQAVTPGGPRYYRLRVIP